jgi:hypothetical protein
MTASATVLDAVQIPELLRGEPDALKDRAQRFDARGVAGYVAVIVVGAGLYGAAMGWWRSPVQAGYNAIKFPFVILATTVGNALLNGMLAPLLGLNLRFRQSLMTVLMSFTIAAAILGAFAPVLFFIIWNTPPLEGSREMPWNAYHFIKLIQVGIIAFAGVAANLRLFQLLLNLSGNRSIARRVLFAWLAGNLFLGSQLVWILRPFIGSPGLPVEFLRATAFQGNFYESVLHALLKLLSSL